MTTQPDPRPRIRDDAQSSTIDGVTCESCGLHTLSLAPSCPECRSQTLATAFGPSGVVWSSTVVRVPVPGREPPYPMAYVDLTDGPRVLCHLTGTDEGPAVGASVQLCGMTPQGDLLAEAAQ